MRDEQTGAYLPLERVHSRLRRRSTSGPSNGDVQTERAAHFTYRGCTYDCDQFDLWLPREHQTILHPSPTSCQWQPYQSQQQHDIFVCAHENDLTSHRC